MKTVERIHAIHLLHFLAQGEKIATQCAQRQTKIATDKKMQVFFRTQSRQEKQHAFVFNSAVRCLRPKKFNHMPHQGLISLESKLNRALDRNDLSESIVAQQLLFEGLGEITLKKVSSGITDRGFGFQRIRKIILAQEHAHHRFGEKQIDKILNSKEFDARAIAVKCKEYLAILHEVLIEMEPILSYYNQDVQSFYTDLTQGLPSPIRSHLC